MGDSRLSFSPEQCRFRGHAAKPQIFKVRRLAHQGRLRNFLLEKMRLQRPHRFLALQAGERRFESVTRLCAAWFYIGIAKPFFRGQPSRALESFQQAIATNVKISEMYIEAPA